LGLAHFQNRLGVVSVEHNGEAAELGHNFQL
jgi:hypothetical protein